MRWRPAPIPRGAYPDADGHSWAEPDLAHAADPTRDPAVLASYRARLEQLWADRTAIGLRSAP